METEITVEELENISQREQVPFLNLLSGYGAEYVLKKIADSGLKEKLWLRDQNVFGMDCYRCGQREGLVFFPAENDREKYLKELKALWETEAGLARLYEPRDRELPFSVEGKNRILLEILLGKYRLPFYVEVGAYREMSAHGEEKRLEGLAGAAEPVMYYSFPQEEYLARGFYQILDKLELLSDLSWYQEMYDIISREPVDGRKVWDSFDKMIQAKSIPSLEKRLDTLRGYQDYGYLNRRWKRESRRREGEAPQWQEVVTCLTGFFGPVFEAVVKDEIFFGDWMPGLRRFL